MINASGCDGAGIGAGDGASAGDIVISGGVVNAQATRGAGIGAGRGAETISSVDSITIAGGRVFASGEFSAGLGAGLAVLSGMTIVDLITITGGSLSVSAIGAPAIGAGGAEDNGTAEVGRLVIAGGEILADGGIGAAHGGHLNTVRFTGRVYLMSLTTDSPAIEGDEITLANVALVVEVNDPPAFGIGPEFEDQNEFTITYHNKTECIIEPFDTFPGSILQIGNLVLPDGHWNVTMIRDDQEKVISVESPTVKSVQTSIWDTTGCRFIGDSRVQAGELVNQSNETAFVADSTRAFFPFAQLVIQTPIRSPVNTLLCLPSPRPRRRAHSRDWQSEGSSSVELSYINTGPLNERSTKNKGKGYFT
jgi:hypothetical protein